MFVFLSFPACTGDLLKVRSNMLEADFDRLMPPDKDSGWDTWKSDVETWVSKIRG